jgi:hypothetical protein
MFSVDGNSTRYYITLLQHGNAMVDKEENGNVRLMMKKWDPVEEELKDGSVDEPRKQPAASTS